MSLPQTIAQDNKSSEKKREPYKTSSGLEDNMKLFCWSVRRGFSRCSSSHVVEDMPVIQRRNRWPPVVQILQSFQTPQLGDFLHKQATV